MNRLTPAKSSSQEGKTRAQALFDSFLLTRRLGISTGRPARPKTLEHYEDSIPPLLRVAPELDASSVYAYLDRLRGRVREASYKSYVIDIRAFLKWAADEGSIAPVKLSVPKLPDVIPPTYSPEQIAAVLRACGRKTWWARRDYTILHLIWDTGSRADELCRLRREDIDLGRRAVRYIGKGGKERYVGVSPTVARLLAQWLRGVPGLPSDYVFPSRKGARLTVSGLRQMVERRSEAADVKVARAVHAWRHTFAVQAYENGADISDLKDDLGHTRYSTVDIYRRAGVRARQSRHDRYSPVERSRG